MKKANLRPEMKGQLKSKELFEQAKRYAYDYIDHLEQMPVSPAAASLAEMKIFDESMPEEPCEASALLDILHRYGSTNTVAQTGGKYFGFVCGGSVPVSLAAKWLSDL